MTSKDAILLWDEAVKLFEKGSSSEALQKFLELKDNGFAGPAKMAFNTAIIQHHIGNSEAAEQSLCDSLAKDPTCALTYFQRGTVLYFLGRYLEAHKDFMVCSQHIRSSLIDYTQLGLRCKLLKCEALYNAGVCQVKAALYDDAVQTFAMAKLAQEDSADIKAQTMHVDAALTQAQTHAADLTLMDRVKGRLYVPPASKLKNIGKKDYLGKAKVIASVTDKDSFSGFVGPTKQAEAQASANKQSEPMTTVSQATTPVAPPIAVIARATAPEKVPPPRPPAVSSGPPAVPPAAPSAPPRPPAMASIVSNQQPADVAESSQTTPPPVVRVKRPAAPLVVPQQQLLPVASEEAPVVVTLRRPPAAGAPSAGALPTQLPRAAGAASVAPTHSTLPSAARPTGTVPVQAFSALSLPSSPQFLRPSPASKANSATMPDALSASKTDSTERPPPPDVVVPRRPRPTAAADGSATHSANAEAADVPPPLPARLAVDGRLASTAGVAKPMPVALGTKDHSNSENQDVPMATGRRILPDWPDGRKESASGAVLPVAVHPRKPEKQSPGAVAASEGHSVGSANASLAYKNRFINVEILIGNEVEALCLKMDSLANLLVRVSEQLSCPPDSFALWYQDESGSQVIISSDDDLQRVWSTCVNSGKVRLWCYARW